ncbi:hypothetical protein ADH70_011350 [Blautia pseudococcoides]|uniref:Uncharacterized protein n=1 Tax=Blautia pseudococcoides TaxID=1796616 RepID=A0A1C7IC49_9FIRM|nr:hypothetical protein A4V09_12890 [Blautia pseudococcoides]ASU29395.1 hypothetical protein ADH70_011350 [Blautia pseudococcoides]
MHIGSRSVIGINPASCRLFFFSKTFPQKPRGRLAGHFTLCYTPFMTARKREYIPGRQRLNTKQKKEQNT